jgi:hypothetical protein
LQNTVSEEAAALDLLADRALRADRESIRLVNAQPVDVRQSKRDICRDLARQRVADGKAEDKLADGAGAICACWLVLRREKYRTSNVGDHQQGARAAKHAFESQAKIFWIESGQAFIEDNQLGVLQKSARDIEPLGEQAILRIGDYTFMWTSFTPASPKMTILRVSDDSPRLCRELTTSTCRPL